MTTCPSGKTYQLDGPQSPVTAPPRACDRSSVITNEILKPASITSSIDTTQTCKEDSLHQTYRLLINPREIHRAGICILMLVTTRSTPPILLVYGRGLIA